MLPILSGDISVYSDSVGFVLEDINPDGIISIVISGKDTRIVFPDWTGFAEKLPDQVVLFRILAVDGGHWRFGITPEMLPAFEIQTPEHAWIASFALKEAGYWEAGWGPVDDLHLARYEMSEFKVPPEMKNARICIMKEGAV